MPRVGEDGTMHTSDPSPVTTTDAAVPAFPAPLRAALLRAVVAAADAVTPFVGAGDPVAVDAAAVAALRLALVDAPAEIHVVAGEGEKDEAPMLHPGEVFGTGAGPELDLVVDPVDGTRLAAAGLPGAMAILAVASRGSFAELGPAHYLDKLVHAGPDAGLDLAASVIHNLDRLSAARGVAVSELTVAVQARPRNAAISAAVRAAGARLHAFEHGDIERVAHAVASDGSVDLLLGIGGAPEGLLEAAIVRAHGGFMQAATTPQSRREYARLVTVGMDPGQRFGLDELCAAPALVVVAPVTGCALEPARADLVELAPGPVAERLLAYASPS
jgi:fructose-1,6-bisphosphatase II